MKNKKLFLIVFIALLFVFFIVNSILFTSTNEAVVNSDIIEIKTEVSGKISTLNAENGSKVKKGEILAEINPEEYQNKLDEKNKKLEEIKRTYKTYSSDVQTAESQIKENKNNLEIAKLELISANSDYIRYKNAYKDGVVTKKDYSNSIKNLDVAQAHYNLAQNNLKKFSEELKLSQSKMSMNESEINKLMSEIETLRLNLSNTTIVSPTNGIVVDNKIGTNINAGEVIFKIEPDEYYIKADFSRLSSIKQGQSATIKVKGIQNKFKGTVEEITNDENMPVKIRFNDDTSSFNMRLNTKAHVKIRL